jgi:hypothetical protein
MKLTFNKLNRALIKRVELLPNVFEFSTEKYGIHEYAAIYGIEKILRRNKVTKLLKSQPNYYLERQHKRLVQYAANGQVSEFNHLSRIILQKSISYRILALNRTIDDWFLLPIRKLRRIWNELSFISKTLSSDLKFKRVWIDKKEGDYARPLGVPTPAWRCYSFMWMNHIESFYKASNCLQPWQHGGRSGVGVLSCYRQLIPRLKESNTIYEFDIKGFFDNISHESIIKRFKETLGSTTAEWIHNILQAKPSGYKLPPEPSTSEAGRAYNFRDEWEHVIPMFGPSYWFRVVQQLPQTVNSANWGVIVENTRKLMPFVINPTSLNGKIYYYEAQEDMPHNTFGQARDNVRGLALPNKGVPQGLGTSPFISTFLTDTYLYELGTENKALIMYMDDGILFASCKSEMETLIKRLTELLKALGLSLAENKSKYVKINGEWQDSIRFLGLRYLPESDTFMSDTRSGTKVQFPAKGDWEDVKALAALNQSSVSGIKQKFDMLINTQAYEAGLKYGFLGCLIAGSQYKDAPPMEERREAIQRGQASAWARIEKSSGFIWKFQDLMKHTEYLTNVSSIATHRFAEFNRKGRKFFIPRRTYRSKKQRI